MRDASLLEKCFDPTKKFVGLYNIKHIFVLYIAEYIEEIPEEEDQPAEDEVESIEFKNKIKNTKKRLKLN